MITRLLPEFTHERITNQSFFCSDGEGLAHETSAKIIIHGIQHTYINCQLIQSIVLLVKPTQANISPYRVHEKVEQRKKEVHEPNTRYCSIHNIQVINLFF